MPIAPGRAAACSIESPIDAGDETRLSTPAPVVVGRATDDNDETRMSSPATAALSGTADDSDETRLNVPTPVVVAGKPTDDNDETRLSSPATAALSGTADDSDETRMSAPSPVMTDRATDDNDETRLSSPATAATDNVTNDETHLGTPSANTHSTPGSDSEEPQPEPPPSGGAVAPQTETELPAGGVHLPIGFMLLGQYKITGLLGQGGFGVTYLAWDTTLDEDVVIKENLPTAISNRNTTTFCVQALTRGTGPGSYEWALNNFLNEAKILRKLRHPNIIEINTAFKEMGTAYYVMPYISGTSLDKVSMPMAEAEIRTILMAMLDALEYLHSRTPILLHRDIKPANILLTPDGTPHPY